MWSWFLYILSLFTGCAFVTFSTRQSALNAIKQLHHSTTMEVSSRGKEVEESVERRRGSYFRFLGLGELKKKQKKIVGPILNCCYTCLKCKLSYQLGSRPSVFFQNNLLNLSMFKENEYQFLSPTTTTSYFHVTFACIKMIRR